MLFCIQASVVVQVPSKLNICGFMNINVVGIIDSAY